MNNLVRITNLPAALISRLVEKIITKKTGINCTVSIAEIEILGTDNHGEKKLKIGINASVEADADSLVAMIKKF